MGTQQISNGLRSNDVEVNGGFLLEVQLQRESIRHRTDSALWKVSLKGLGVIPFRVYTL